MIAAASGIAAAALSVSPVRLRLAGAASRTVTIRNAGDAPAAVEVRPASFALDRRGGPAIGREGRSAAGWLHVQPGRVVLAPGRTAVVAVSSAAPAGASPGDHPAVVLLTTQPRRAAGVAVRLRIGVVVFVRVAGRVVHRLELGRLVVRRRVLAVAVANRGNVVERARVRVALSRRGRPVARLGPVERMLLPHGRAVERFRYRGRIRGPVIARVEVGTLRRTFRIRL